MLTLKHHKPNCHARSEANEIKRIVKVVIEKLSGKSTYVSEELVGIDAQIEKILLLLTKNTFVIGIWGIGGIGKTTLAEAAYNRGVSVSKFDAHYFLQDVHKKSLEICGMQSLQSELLSKLLKEDIHIDTRFIGSTLIRDRLRNVRSFVVFDDVSESNQIERLGVQHFGLGSKIIITSRDRQVLKNIGVNELHQVMELEVDHSLELFCEFAFKQYNPIAGFWDLSMKFVEYAGGNPLALKVLGAALSRKNRGVWESALQKQNKYPEGNIIGPLKISFDGLDDLERNIFLDLACFFRYRESFVIELLENWDIVRQESKDHRKQSRLCIPEDIYNVFKNNMGTESITGISLDMDDITELRIRPSIFEKMINLVFIKFRGHNKLLLPNQKLSHLPDMLTCLDWWCCPVKSLPSNFSPNNLVILRLRGSNIEHLWNEDQDIDLVNSRVMELDGCENLRKIPNLLGAKRLESLWCNGCESLVELPCMTPLISRKSLDLGRGALLCRVSKEIAKVMMRTYVSESILSSYFGRSYGSYREEFGFHVRNHLNETARDNITAHVLSRIQFIAKQSIKFDNRRILASSPGTFSVNLKSGTDGSHQNFKRKWSLNFSHDSRPKFSRDIMVQVNTCMLYLEKIWFTETRTIRKHHFHFPSALGRIRIRKQQSKDLVFMYSPSIQRVLLSTLLAVAYLLLQYPDLIPKQVWVLTMRVTINHIKE
ncbi:Disease resistance protein [Corchorus olitorius]|uniref:Disease resistance protein n=1 Tax=Corchorus olitorius TaxID=93759 RepID=A0A1R3KFD4_9ROSI|nr:Disease resistance protein [Corchorus olitorius]